jgi:hypothetical protein
MDLANSVEGFFHDEVDRAFRDRGLECGTLVEHYVVQLLAAYAARGIPDGPLALKLASAIDAAPRERRRSLREIGDTSLYVSGFWADSLNDKMVDVDYYIELGGSAYGELARGGTTWTGDPFGAVFGELASNFTRFVEVLALVSRRTTAHATSNEDVLRLYRTWQRTGSSHAAARLASLGVVPPKDGRPQ